MSESIFSTVVAAFGHAGGIIAVTDDGRVWFRSDRGGNWFAVSAVPGTAAAVFPGFEKTGEAES